MTEQKKNKLALASLLFGAVALIFSLIFVIIYQTLSIWEINDQIYKTSICPTIYIIITIIFMLSIILGFICTEKMRIKNEKSTIYSNAGKIISALGLLIFFQEIGIIILLITALIVLNISLVMNAIKTKEFGEILLAIIIGISTIIIFIFVFYIYLISSQSPKIVRDQCISTAGIECKNSEIDISNNKLSLAFANNLGYSITLSNVNISYKGKTVSQCDTPGRIIHIDGTTISSDNPVQPEEVFQFRNCTLTTTDSTLSEKRPGDKVKFDFAFNYIRTDENESPHLASGTLTATAR